ncbi:MAG TPA: FtsX-like permease family protein [bacterium]|nr:FtsX-like permease family protein [bacterium]
MTIIAISVSCIALLLFGGFVSSIMIGVETGILMSTGHLHIYKKGFSDYGAGNTANYGIDNYKGIIEIINNSDELKPYTRVTSSLLLFGGIAGNYDKGISNTFIGLGVDPAGMKKMYAWNFYNIRLTKKGLNFELDENDANTGLIGYGLAKMLKLNELLDENDKISGFPEIQKQENSEKNETPKFEDTGSFDIGGLLDSVELPETRTSNSDKYKAKIDLLAATAGGAPNVVNLYLNKAEKFPVKVHNENMILANIELAQNLVYGQSEKKVTAIVMQLHNTQDMEIVKQILTEKFRNAGYFDKLEIKRFDEIRPEYNQINNMFITIFSFVAIIMLMIIIVILLNTMSMSVMERYNEIGTLRAIGLRRFKILKQFIAEGILLGCMGSIIGVIISAAISFSVNAAELTWIPPNYANEMLLSIHLFTIPWFLPSIVAGIIAVAGIASIIPANKAANMNIVDALRHN